MFVFIDNVGVLRIDTIGRLIYVSLFKGNIKKFERLSILIKSIDKHKHNNLHSS